MTEDWQGLNKRQKQYLNHIFDVDQATEYAVKMEASRGRWNSIPASVWRWIPYNASGASLYRKLQDDKLIDPGTGSTFESLAERGYIDRKWESTGILGMSILYVYLLPKGRKLVRKNRNIKPTITLPVGTLRKWHWQALCRAYVAGDEGMSYNIDTGDGFGYVSWNTVLRLRDYRFKKQDMPLIKEAKVPCEPYLSIPWPGHSGFMESEKSALVITEYGKQFYRENWQKYKELYPDVKAPKP